ncbi:Ribosome biogenesis protein ERB1 [Endocarpon pusillum Z07020]|uniref:Ribosome biogenesis protein ERB1 n=1 Tax=Endocarpon pusillum (strain Z07020 / HMAS-L-300199) TaxID=1263415 RepID=U1HK41_ENDPU|nr:Ribosome biogenesis protein ERB1 [Endocarpon pusillum Z07020]ERF70605.1 Ribosome biogenesis protein ERB1 [Endocarpon pusillum Z07020]
MASLEVKKKRKAVTRDVDSGPAIVSGDEPGFAQLDGTLASSDDSEIGDNDDSIFDFGSTEESSEPVEDLSDDDGGGSARSSDDGLSKGSIDQKAKIAQPVDIEVETTGLSGEIPDNEEEDDRPNFRVQKDANGNDRYIYDEIDPDDNSELDELGPEENTIGNIPLSFYDHFPHIGYNINGKKIMRPAKGAALDALLDSMEIPKGWTGLTDPSTGKPLELSQEELNLLKKVQMNEIPEDGYDPYEPTVEYFTSKTEIMPLSAAPEPKRRFVPSKHEAKRVMKIVRAIREGRILPYKTPEEGREDDADVQNYDIWANEKARPEHIMHVPAPKLPPPGFDESYHPPPEYLPDKGEKKAWEDADIEDREKEYLPTDHDSLRKVPGYENFVKEKFERCLDLYLAPRVRRSKLNIDPESLLPKLPSPEELRPFPTTCGIIYRGHKGRVRSLSVDPSGLWLASGGDDGTVRVWQLDTGRQIWSVSLSSNEAVNVVRWRPGKDAFILAVAVGDNVYLCVPPICDPDLEAASLEVLDAGWGYSSSTSTTKLLITWTRPSNKLSDNGVHALISLGHTAKTLSFHRRGDYFVTVCPAPSTPSSSAIAIHTLSKHLTQYPFRRRLKGGGPPQTAHFHPSKPILFVANQRSIRAYDLSRQSLLKILQPGARWISSFDIHPTSSAISGSDNLIAGSYDRRLLWHDLDLSPRPYKTLRYHQKAIRAVKFHPSGQYPLFADASDDGTVQVFHGEVVADMMSNARIVPLKVLKGHKVVGDLGVLDIDWHPVEPWILSAGGDGTCRLWR